jgi:dienelactone hydrolase
MNEYTKSRTFQLAGLGYISMAVDMYGKGKNAGNPKEAQELATPFYKDPKLEKKRLEAAIATIKKYKQTLTDKIAAIGYCFGESVVLNSAKLGSDLKEVVSFHGGLTRVPANKTFLKLKILVCHEEDDKFVLQQDVETFKQLLDSIGADYTSHPILMRPMLLIILIQQRSKNSLICQLIITK